MNLWPVIVRELRQQARQRFTYALRLLGVGLTSATATLFALSNAFNPNMGGWLFAGLHITLFFAIWVLVPLSASDCISRERREGTLGLLFLTPLRAREIVIAKGLANGLRAITFLLAVLPVFTIPFLLGGVSWEQAAMSVLINFSAICWALGASLLASAIVTHSLRAMALAMLLSIAGMFAHAILLGTLSAPGVFFTGNLFGFLDDRLLYGMAPPGLGPTRLTAGVLRGGWSAMLTGGVESALLATLILYAAIWLAAVRVRQSWRDEPPPEWVQSIQRTFLTPFVWRSLLRRWMRWKIERNPVGWLEQRTWMGRLVTWTWFAIVISIYSAILTDRNFFRGFSGMQETLAWLMMGSIAASASGSFRRERESGVLELLLVTPMSSRNIARGRLFGLWAQFLPAVSILLAIWWYFQTLFRGFGREDDFGRIFFFGASFVCLPVIGLYFSLRCRNYLAAFLVTLGVGLLLPMFLTSWLTSLVWLFYAGSWPLRQTAAVQPGAAVVQLVLAGWLFGRLLDRLERRRFPLDRTGW